MEIEEKTNQEDTRSFADKWLNNVFETLMKLEDYERLLKNGCSDIMDFVQNKELDLAIVQEKNYQLFMTEIEIILNDINHFIDKKEYLSLLIKFKIIRSKENEANGFLRFNKDLDGYTGNYILKGEFYEIIPYISNLRGMVVTSLLGFYNPKFQKNTDGDGLK